MGDAAAAAERLVIVNPASASGRTARRWQPLVDRLRELGVPARAELTTGQDDATRIAREFVRGGGREIVVLGGDGTVGETAAGLVDERGELLAGGVTLGLVHQGTGGDMVRGLEIPREAMAAVEVAARGATREVDLGVATFRSRGSDEELTRAFLVNANVGMGADVVADVTGKLKKLGNSGAFAVAAVSNILRNRPRRVHVTAPGRDDTLDIVDVMIGNNRYMGGGMMATPHAEVDDGELDVVLVSAAPRLKLVRKFPKIYKGTHLEDPIARWFRAPHFRIEAPDADQGVVLDGELVGRTPASFRVIPRAVAIRVPG